MANTEAFSLSGRRVDDADFSRAHLHSPNLEGLRITDGWLRDADVSAYIAGMRVNGVEIAPLVEAELDRRYPERAKLRATDPEGLAEAWQIVEDIWARTVTRAEALPEDRLYRRVENEWSFVETLRHLILATDAWLFRMVRSVSSPYHPWGLGGSFLSDPKGLGLDYAAQPTLAEVLAVRRERMDAVRETIANLSTEELHRVCIPPAVPGHPNEERAVLDCLHVILDEEWEHNRYANRDLDVLEANAAAP